MIHMESDHRCVMATFMITTPKKDGHRKNLKSQARDNKTRQKGSNWKNTGDENPELEKRYQEIIEKSRKSWSRKQRIESTQRKTPKQKAAPQAKSEKTEAEGKEADEEFSEIEVRNDVETVRETDEEHPGYRTQRTRKQVLSCSMSDTTWTRERRPPSRSTRPAKKARSRWSTNEK